MKSLCSHDVESETISTVDCRSSDSDSDHTDDTFHPEIVVDSTTASGFNEEENDRLSDDEEEGCTDESIGSGCNCQQKCLLNIPRDQIQDHIFNLREMDKESKDMYIMGALHRVNRDSKRSRYGERMRTRYEYKFNATNICRKAFLIIYDIGERTLKNLIRHVNLNGNIPRIHGNKRRKPVHALSFADIERAVSFIVHFSEENGLPQPAAPRGRDDTAPVYLPADMTKTMIHSMYAVSCDEASVRVIKKSAFLGIWSQCCSHIKVNI